MSLVIDYSFARPDPALIKAGGAAGVVRYVSPGDNPKNLTKPEYDALKQHGLPVALVWEINETSWTGGYQAGVQQGGEARAMATQLGFPINRPIYHAYDYNVLGTMLPQVMDFQHGFNTGNGGLPQGAYGTGLVLGTLLAAKLTRWHWQTNARGWNGNAKDFPQACLIQHYEWPYPGLPTTSVDVNEVKLPDWGQDDYKPPIPKETKLYDLITIPDAPADQKISPKTVWLTDQVSMRPIHDALELAAYEHRLGKNPVQVPWVWAGQLLR